MGKRRQRRFENAEAFKAAKHKTIQEKNQRIAARKIAKASIHFRLLGILQSRIEIENDMRVPILFLLGV